MYKKAAIATLIVAPLIVDLASRAVPPEQPAVVAENAATAPETSSAPPPLAPPPPAAQTGDPMAVMSTEPTLDTTPQAAGTNTAPAQPVPQTPMLGTGQPAPAQTPFEPTPIPSEQRNPRF